MQKSLVKELPVKLKKTKVTKRYFNFLVIISDDRKTIIEQRNEKGIWQKLYQFPLIETSKRVNLALLQKDSKFIKLFNNQEYSASLFNQDEIIHKLSHQHLYTKFWIITLNTLPKRGISLKNIRDYPVPTLINNFINEFNF